MQVDLVCRLLWGSSRDVAAVTVLRRLVPVDDCSVEERVPVDLAGGFHLVELVSFIGSTTVPALMAILLLHSMESLPSSRLFYSVFHL